MSQPDGGPAFGHGAENGHCCGATLRDLFAGMALQGLLGNPNVDVRDESNIRAVYQIADAMLKQREEEA